MEQFWTFNLVGTFIGGVALLAFLGWICNQLKQKYGLHKTLAIVLYFHFLPVLAAPIVLFLSIFIFDNPPNFFIALLLFLAVNSYSLILIGSAAKAIKSHHKSKTAYLWLTPSLICWLLIIVFMLV